MSVTLRKYQLAASVLELWENAVRRFAPDEYMRWLQLLEQLPDELSDEQLRNALAPLAAKNDREQKLFARLFEEAGRVTEVPDSPVPPAGMRRFLPWILPLLLLTAGMCWLIARLSDTPPQRPLQKVAILLETAPDSMAVKCPDDSVNLDILVTAFFENGRDTLATPLGRYRIERGLCVRFEAGDSIGAEVVNIKATFRAQGTMKEPKETVTYDLPVEVSAIVNRLPEDTAGPDTLSFAPYPFQHDSLLRARALGQPDELKAFLDRWSGWIKVGMVALALLLLFALAWWLSRDKRNLIVDREKPGKPPYVWNIRLKNLDPPEPGDDFGQTLNALRRRAAAGVGQLDMPETVRATIRKAGMAEFRFQQLSTPPEYLMLVEQDGARDHQARLYDDLYQLLLANEIPVERYFFAPSTHLYQNEQYTGGLNLEELLLRYPNHRLLLMSAGRQLFSARAPRLAQWTEAFGRWKTRALLSPLPAESWGRRERSLAEFFRFAPASLAGLRKVLEDFETDPVFQAGQLDKLKPLALPAPVLLENGDLLATLEKHYPDPLSRAWIAACALWPEIHYDLTLWLGHRLSQVFQRPVATLERLTDLMRLPWFGSGAMPDVVRGQLIDWMRKTHPGLEQRLRQTLQQLLEQNGPDPESAAFDLYAMRVAFNEWMICKDPARKKLLEDQIAAWMDQNPGADFITVRELNGPPGLLDQVLPETWKKRLFKGGLTGMGLRRFWKNLGWLWVPLGILTRLAFLALTLLSPKTPDCLFMAPVVVGQDTLKLCLDEQDNQFLYWEYQLRDLATNNDALLFDSVSAAILQPNLPLLPECRANAATAAYNAGVRYALQVEALRATQSGFRNDTSGLKIDAYNWFKAAAQLDSSLAWIQAGLAWCDGTAPPPIPARGVCRQIADLGTPIGFRNRDLTIQELNDIYQKPGGILAKKTLIQSLKPGEQLELLGTTEHMYQVRYQGREGYVAKSVQGRNTLAPCRSTIAPPPNLELPVMIPIKGGTFTMGSPESEESRADDETQHQVTLSDFEIGRTEVTIGQYLAFCDETRTHYPEWLEPGNDFHIETGSASLYKSIGMSRQNKNRPVTGVSWEDAVAYCRWLSQKTGRKYRLPTEAEWEYAARGGQNFVYAGSNDLGKVGWYSANSKSQIQPVAGLQPNAFGLYDMSGNVWEWCQDRYGKYPISPQTNPQGPTDDSNRVLRGGSWDYGPAYCRVAFRGGWSPDRRLNYLGFRLARTN